jgi:hypothetical protein
VSLDASSQRFLSFGTMVVPSNDSFFGNANPPLLPLFDGTGNFMGSQSWTFTGANVWDAGTEVNDPLDGGVFVSGINGALGTDEGGVIHLQAIDGLDNVIGLPNGAGLTTGRALGNDGFLRISVAAVPEPGTYGILAALFLGGLALLQRARSRRHPAESELA